VCVSLGWEGIIYVGYIALLWLLFDIVVPKIRSIIYTLYTQWETNSSKDLTLNNLGSGQKIDNIYPKIIQFVSNYDSNSFVYGFIYWTRFFCSSIKKKFYCC